MKKKLEETLEWARKQGTTDMYEIYERVRSHYGLSRFEAGELTLKVLDKIK